MGFCQGFSIRSDQVYLIATETEVGNEGGTELRKISAREKEATKGYSDEETSYVN